MYYLTILWQNSQFKFNTTNKRKETGRIHRRIRPVSVRSEFYLPDEDNAVDFDFDSIYPFQP